MATMTATCDTRVGATAAGAMRCSSDAIAETAS
jgi:hypothetical protein